MNDDVLQGPRPVSKAEEPSGERPRLPVVGAWARRLAAILAVAAYAVPWVPRLIHAPRVRYSDFGAGAGCVLLSAALIVSALVAALLGTRGTNRREYWTQVAAVGFWWPIALALVPV